MEARKEHKTNICMFILSFIFLSCMKLFYMFLEQLHWAFLNEIVIWIIAFSISSDNAAILE